MQHVRVAMLIAAVVWTMDVPPGVAQSLAVQGFSDLGSVPEAAPAASPTSHQSGASPIRRLPAVSGGSRLSGEEASIQLPVYVTRKEANAKARFRLATLSSVSVAPENGTLVVSLNGVNVKTVPVGAAYSLRVSEFDLPEGLLRHGWNSVGIAAHLRHRVDCSLDATNELWTRVDRAETGFIFPDGAMGVSDAADIAAIGPRPDGAVPIGIVLDRKRRLQPEAVERLGRAVQGVALAGRFAQAVVEFDSPDEDGLDLVLGTVADIAGTIDLATIGNVAGPTIAVIPAVAGRRPMIVVTGQSDAELDVAIAKLGTPAPIGSAPGLNALESASGHRVSPDGQSLAFSELGVENQELAGRTLRLGFSVALPKDFLAADYGRVSVDFAGGYAAGLDADAQIIVEINGRNAGSIRLSSANGDTFRHRRQFLPLSAFRPGQNRVEMRVNAPDASDVGCDTSANARAPRVRVWLSRATRITFPPLARVGRLPDLAMTSSGGFPFAGSVGKTTLVVPTPDRATMGAALTALARLGLAAGRQIPFAFAANQPTEKSGHLLIVAPARALDPASMRQAGLDPEIVRQAWSAPAELSPAARSSISRASLRRRANEGDWPDTCATEQPTARGVAPSREPASEDPAEDSSGARSADVSARIGRAFGYVRGLIAGKASPQAPAASTALFHNASLLVAQGPREDDQDSIITIITSPNAATLASSVTCLVEPSVWSRVSGRLSLLDASTGALTGHEPESKRYVATQDFSIHNQRLMIAGWLSLNPHIFIVLAFLLVLPLAATTHFLVRNVGRRNR